MAEEGRGGTGPERTCSAGRRRQQPGLQQSCRRDDTLGTGERTGAARQPPACTCACHPHPLQGCWDTPHLYVVHIHCRDAEPSPGQQVAGIPHLHTRMQQSRDGGSCREQEDQGAVAPAAALPAASNPMGMPASGPKASLRLPPWDGWPSAVASPAALAACPCEPGQQAQTRAACSATGQGDRPKQGQAAARLAWARGARLQQGQCRVEGLGPGLPGPGATPAATRRPPAPAAPLSRLFAAPAGCCLPAWQRGTVRPA